MATWWVKPNLDEFLSVEVVVSSTGRTTGLKGSTAWKECIMDFIYVTYGVKGARGSGQNVFGIVETKHL